MAILKRSFRHLTPRYVWDRVSVMIYERAHPRAPWLTQTMISILDSWLKPQDIGLEWGSGRSTVWLARRVSTLTSVEHNQEWAGRVGRMLEDAQVSERVRYELAEDGLGETSDSAYVRVVEDLPRVSLDFALIDGVSRDYCALACIDWIKPGGIVIVDNIDRYVPQTKKSRAPSSRGLGDGYASEGWQRFAESVREWRCIWTTNGVTDTALWVKPMG